jgi:hypothetical protein
MRRNAALGTGREEYVKAFNLEHNALAATVNREREARKAPDIQSFS